MDERHPFICDDELTTEARAMIQDFALRILSVANENKKRVKEDWLVQLT